MTGPGRYPTAARPATTRSAILGHRTVGTAEALGLDPEGGKWVVICEDHHTVVNVDRRTLARSLATYEFCEECQPQT